MSINKVSNESFGDNLRRNSVCRSTKNLRVDDEASVYNEMGEIACPGYAGANMGYPSREREVRNPSDSGFKRGIASLRCYKIARVRYAPICVMPTGASRLRVKW